MGCPAPATRVAAVKRFASILAGLRPPSYPARSLELGCGPFATHSILQARFPGWLHAGLEIDADELRPARSRPVILADAQRLPFCAAFALILIRHPDVALHPDGWSAVLAGCPRVLVDGGILVATTYSLEEREFVRRRVALERCVVDETALAPVNLAGEDRCVLAYVKAG